MEFVPEKKNEVLIILDDTPPSVNNYKACRWTGKFIQWYITKKGKEFKAKMIQKINELQDHKIFKGNLHADIHLTFPTKRKHDVDNYSKVLLDSMNKLVYEDDNQISELHIKRHYKKGEPSTIIKVMEI